MVLLPSKGLTAISVPAPGESPKLIWAENDLAPSAASPVVAKDKVYTVNRSGVLLQASLVDGKVLSKTRLGIGQQWATPAVIAGHAYCFDSNGKAAVVKLADEKAEVVWTGEFGESIQASPAIADGALYIRSDKHLWKIAN
jgi:outer membrane protein assembly factor BamB